MYTFLSDFPAPCTLRKRVRLLINFIFMDQQNFETNQNQIEADLHRVGQEVREQVSSGIAPEVTERELVKRSLHPIVQHPPVSAQTSHQSPTADDATLPDYLQNESPAIKERVERLVEDAFKHGVEHAAIEAQKSGPLVVDALHDVLSDRFYEELKKRGIV